MIIPTIDDVIYTIKGLTPYQNGTISFETLLSIKKQIEYKCPTVIKALRFIDNEITGKKCKGYYLVNRPNKKHGYLYYVRYYHNGKTLTSMWNTHTNNREQAELFAHENRERIIREFSSKKENRLYTVLNSYYKENSDFLRADENRYGKLAKAKRLFSYSFINNVFIPFLKDNKISTFYEITPSIISIFQDFLLTKGKKPQTINDYMIIVKKIFQQLARTGELSENIFKNVKPLDIKNNDRKIRGCHEIDKVNGVFNQIWKNEEAYLLCLLIYSTGMRNKEIEMIQVKDIINIEDCHFIDIKASKTANGIRLVPLHYFVYNKVLGYIEKHKLAEDDFLFISKRRKRINFTIFQNANILLGEKIGVNEKELEENNITFYSGRHFWKTLMNAYELGDNIEEMFMGHKVSGDVKKRYNHRDKQGKAKMLEKAREVFSILDKSLFHERAATAV